MYSFFFGVASEGCDLYAPHAAADRRARLWVFKYYQRLMGARERASETANVVRLYIEYDQYLSGGSRGAQLLPK